MYFCVVFFDSVFGFGFVVVPVEGHCVSGALVFDVVFVFFPSWSGEFVSPFVDMNGYVVFFGKETVTVWWEWWVGDVSPVVERLWGNVVVFCVVMMVVAQTCSVVRVVPAIGP